MNQDFEDLEILVVDDCSTDNSLDVVRKISSKHKNGFKVRIVNHSVNQGTGATRQSGIDEARGEYLLFLDGDDYISPNAITLLYNEMQRSNTDIVLGQHAIVGGILNHISELGSSERNMPSQHGCVLCTQIIIPSRYGTNFSGQTSYVKTDLS